MKLKRYFVVLEYVGIYFDSNQVKYIGELVAIQHDCFLATIFDRSKLTDDKTDSDEMQTTFFVPLNEFLRSTIDYSIDRIVIFKAFSQ